MQRSYATAGVIGPPAAGGADSSAPGVAGPSGVGVAGSDGSAAGDSTAGEEGESEGSGWDDAQPARARAGRRTSRGRSLRIPTLWWSGREMTRGEIALQRPDQRRCPARREA